MTAGDEYTVRYVEQCKRGSEDQIAPARKHLEPRFPRTDPTTGSAFQLNNASRREPAGCHKRIRTFGPSEGVSESLSPGIANSLSSMAGQRHKFKA